MKKAKLLMRNRKKQRDSCSQRCLQFFEKSENYQNRGCTVLAVMGLSKCIKWIIGTPLMSIWSDICFKAELKNDHLTFVTPYLTWCEHNSASDQKCIHNCMHLGIEGALHYPAPCIRQENFDLKFINKQNLEKYSEISNHIHHKLLSNLE